MTDSTLEEEWQTVSLAKRKRTTLKQLSTKRNTENKTLKHEPVSLFNTFLFVEKDWYLIWFLVS